MGKIINGHQDGIQWRFALFPQGFLVQGFFQSNPAGTTQAGGHLFHGQRLFLHGFNALQGMLRAHLDLGLKVISVRTIIKTD